jgi:hypothetical protein
MAQVQAVLMIATREALTRRFSCFNPQIAA